MYLLKFRSVSFIQIRKSGSTFLNFTGGVRYENIRIMCMKSVQPLNKSWNSPSALLIILIIAWMFTSCGKKEMIMTVQGLIPSGSLGLTLAHEHVLVDFIGADSTGYTRWNRDTVIARVMPFLLEAKQQGVRSLVECTPAFLGRDPLLLKMLAERSGMFLITNTGYYGAAGNRAIPVSAYNETIDQIADRWVREWENGIEQTGIKPGFIKIGVPEDSILSPIHLKIVRAAARAHLRTGLVINSHTGPAAPAFAELAVLREEGVAPSAFIWTHAQRASGADLIKAARMGAWISLDNVDSTNINTYVAALENLKANGLLHRALISHDAGWYDVVSPDGHIYRGYTAIFTHLVPALSKAGFTGDDIHQLLVTNPGEAYTIRVHRI